jgi:hypothetical protein
LKNNWVEAWKWISVALIEDFWSSPGLPRRGYAAEPKLWPYKDTWCGGLTFTRMELALRVEPGQGRYHPVCKNNLSIGSDDLTGIYEVDLRSEKGWEVVRSVIIVCYSLGSGSFEARLPESEKWVLDLDADLRAVMCDYLEEGRWLEPGQAKPDYSGNQFDKNLYEQSLKELSQHQTT